MRTRFASMNFTNLINHYLVVVLIGLLTDYKLVQRNKQTIFDQILQTRKPRALQISIENNNTIVYEFANLPELLIQKYYMAVKC